MKTTIRTLRALIATAICAVLAFGVYSAGAHEGHGTPAASPAASPVATPLASPSASTTVELLTGDVKFLPRELTIPANTDVTLKITNKGALPHDFVMPQAGITSGTITSGTSIEITLNLAPGIYQFNCTVPGHRQAGMTGKIIVK